MTSPTLPSDSRSPLQPGASPPHAGMGVLDAAFESAAVGLLVTTPAGVVLRANAAFAAMVGMRPDEVMGRTVVELTHPEDRPETVRLLRELGSRARDQVDMEKRYVRPDGTVQWVNVTAVASYGVEGEASHLLATVRDLTATRELTAELSRWSTRYRRLVDANIIGVTVATPAGVIEANDEMLRLAGMRREEFETIGLDWRSITTPEDLERDEQGIREILERGRCTPFEKHFVWRDGTRIPVLVGGALLKRDPLTWIAFALDLSERRRAEAERGRLLDEASAARDVAESALQARDALLARVTHELRTPLAANVGYASMMLEGIPEPLPPVHQESVRRMLANQRHLLALMDGLLEFARGASGRSAYDLQAIDVNSLLAGVETSVAPQLRAAGLTYECLECESPVLVVADRIKTLQILVNLVGNAIKFTPSGGRITLGAVEAGDRVHIQVTDTGTGIVASQLASIFEPFVQGGSDAEALAMGVDRHRGFGLGLAISRELARGMGGDLLVESTPGVGSRFTLILPRA